MSSNINISELSNKLGIHIKKNEKIIEGQLFYQSQFSKYFRQISGIQGAYQQTYARIGEVIQSFQKEWTPKGEVEFKPIILTPRHFKIDFTLFPDQITGEWIGYLRKENLSKEKYPIVKYIVNNLLLPKLEEDREMSILYSGKYKTPTPGVANSASETMDGIEEVMNKNIANGRISVIPLGDITEGNAYDKLEEFHDALPPLIRSQKLNYFISPTIGTYQYRDRRANFGVHMNYDPSKSNKIEKTRHELVELNAMIGKTRIWTTPDWNLVRIYDINDVNSTLKFTVESEKRLINIYTDWMEGVGFLIPEMVFCSDGDLPVN